MQFVQKAVFSSDGISQDLVTLLGSFGETQVKKAFENAKKQTELVNLMKEVLSYKFIDLSGEKYNITNSVPYQSMERVLKQLKYFTVDSEYYKDLETKKRKLRILLDSVTFVEAEAILKLLRGEYDVGSVKSYLYPQKKRKATKESEEQVLE